MEAAATELPTGLAIDELLDWRPEHGVLSVCVAVDRGDRGEGWRIDLRNKLDAAIEEGDDAHDRGRALRAAGQRVLNRFEEEELPSGRCHIGFLEAAEKRGRDIWTAAQMTDFATSAGYGPRARLTQLLELLDEGAAIGVVAVSSERVHLYEWKLGELELVHDWEAELYMIDWRERKAEKPGDLAHMQGAASSGRDQYDQRLDHNRARFLKETGGLIANEAQGRDWRRVIAFGDPEHVRELGERAGKGTEVELAEVVDVINEKRGRLLSRVNDAVRRGNRRRELALIQRAEGGAATPGGRGALGLIDVQRCLTEGRVQHLIYDANAQSSELADLEDEVVERALRTSAEITPVEDEAAEVLREHGGIAAVLRY
jgi:release factor family 5